MFQKWKHVFLSCQIILIEDMKVYYFFEDKKEQRRDSKIMRTCPKKALEQDYHDKKDYSDR